MRVPTLYTAQRGFTGIETRQAEMARLQAQVASGLRVQSPSDDPLAAAQAERARSQEAQAQQQHRAAQLATSVLATADGALANGINSLQRARELLVAAGDAAYNQQDRQALALELQSARDTLLQVANSGDGAGGYVFGGQGSNGAPMAGSSTPAFVGTAGVQRIGDGGRLATTVDGDATFIAIAKGNGVFATASAAGNTGTGWIDTGSVANPAQLTGHNYTIAIAGTAAAPTYTVTDTTTGTAVASNVPYSAGADIAFDGQRMKISGAPAVGDSFTVGPAGQQSIFATLDQAIALLNAPPAAANAWTEQLQHVQAHLDRGLENMILMRSRVGEEMASVDVESDSASQQELSATQRRSDLRDLDLAEAISQLQTSQTGLDAALKSYSAIARKSLFDLLG